MKRTRLYANYALAVLLVVLTFLGRALGGLEQPLVIIFVLPILLSACIGGLGPGLLATALCLFGVAYFLLPPIYSLSISNPNHFLIWVILGVLGVVISLLCESKHRSTARALEAERQKDEALAKQREAAIRHSEEKRYYHLIDILPVAAYICDLKGRITYHNQRASELCGSEPSASRECWCCTIRAFKPDGDRLPLGGCNLCPAHVAVEKGCAVGPEIIIERPDSRRAHVIPYTEPLHDEAGHTIGALNLLMDITDLKQKEDALKLSELRFQRVVDCNVVGMVFVAPDGKVLHANDHYLRVLGFSREDLQNGKVDWRAQTPAEWLPADEKAFEDLRSRGVCSPYEKEYVRKDGQRIWVYISGTALPGADHPSLWFIEDVTERKRSEQHLVEANWRAETLAQVSADLLMRGSTADVLTAIFERISKRLGLDVFLHFRLGEDVRQLRLEAWGGVDEETARQLHTVQCSDCLCGKVAQRRERIVVSNVQDSEEPGARLIRKLGLKAYTCHPLIAHGTLLGTISFGTRSLRAFSGETLELLQSVADQVATAVARREAEEALRASEARFHQLADSMPQIVWTARPDGFTDYFNSKWYESVRAEPGQLGLEAWQRFTHPDDLPRALERHRQSLQTGQPAEFECRTLMRSGEYRWHLVRALPVRDEAGRVVRWYGTATDINDQKITENALRDAHRRKDEFLAILGHELRNPLAPIRNAIEVLIRLGTHEPILERSREIINRQVTHMSRLIDDLLDVSRITRGKVQLRKDSVDLTEIVRTVCVDMGQSIENSGLRLASNLPAESVWVYGDAARFRQVVGNLVHNAIKFTDPGGTVTVSLNRQGERAEIIVQDTGIGMDADILGRIFESFSQGDTSLDRSRGGLGLGLALVKGIAELHGGSVNAESRGIGRGSTFTVRLPLEKHPHLRATAGVPSSASRHVPPSQRILIIEDNIDAAESLQTLLTVLGNEVAVAHSGPEGLERARQFKPQVVLCDIGLPGSMDGHAVARAMRRDPALSAVYLIAMTGYGQEEDRRRAREAGFDQHLTKPADTAALEQLLTR
ncbi:MAG TPA: PAS domain S-box protein [Planctomycetota bacterium]|jgi:PAS domain S-box-containing protein